MGAFTEGGYTFVFRTDETEGELLDLKSAVEERNRRTSEREVRDFIADPPEQYFAYVSVDPLRVTTWMGDALSEPNEVHLGHVWRSNIGDRRQSISFRAVNGYDYYGVFYCDAGNYCRLRRKKGAK